MAYKTRRRTRGRRNTKSRRKVKGGRRRGNGDRVVPKIVSTKGPTTISTADYWKGQGLLGRGLSPELMASIQGL